MLRSCHKEACGCKAMAPLRIIGMMARRVIPKEDDEAAGGGADCMNEGTTQSHLCGRYKCQERLGPL